VRKFAGAYINKIIVHNEIAISGYNNSTPAFYLCKINEVYFDNTVTTCNQYLFYQVIKINKVYLHENITTIGQYFISYYNSSSTPV
jgi:hypothetical protein